MRRLSFRRGAAVRFCGGDDRGERFRELSLDTLVAGDENACEEGLVEGASQSVRCADVGVVAICGECHCVVQILLKRFEFCPQYVETVANRGHLAINAFLFRPVEVVRDRAVEVAVEELLAALHEPRLLAEEFFLCPLR
ncbi:hypothetical protein [Microbacterium sp. VKM Ac-2923]|uniref:hypothetical protein n=1 Tax=Microbacterium sp. VKM Ac-2923 TaxID=2929476 RepID=UPI001FB25C43|nr:hypothetical protein [Microbacterium sp. VKM Ac-2923]MCJ1707138.1 hypothetical protein [Microbacterium sp. VKM Ac-2923]